VIDNADVFRSAFRRSIAAGTWLSVTSQIVRAHGA
jgi:hypothetical protein